MAATITPVAKTPAQGRVVQGTIQRPAQAPAGYGLAYQMGGPHYMYGETPFYGARYADGGFVPGQIYGNMRGSREGADMFGFWPTMMQSSPYATASQMYTPGLGVMPLVGYPSKYPHVVMGGYSDYGSGIVNQAMGMMLPLLMMGLYRQMFPMAPQAPVAAAAGKGGGRGGSGGGGGGAIATGEGQPSATLDETAINLNPSAAHWLSGQIAAHPELIAKYNGKALPSDFLNFGSRPTAANPDSSQERARLDIERVRRERAEQEARDAQLPWYTRTANTFNRYAGLGPFLGGLRLAGDAIDYAVTR